MGLSSTLGSCAVFHKNKLLMYQGYGNEPHNNILAGILPAAHGHDGVSSSIWRIDAAMVGGKRNATTSICQTFGNNYVNCIGVICRRCMYLPIAIAIV